MTGARDARHSSHDAPLSAVFPEVLLVIEAATTTASVALIQRAHVIAERSVVMGPARDDALLPAIAAALDEAQFSIRDVRAIACGSGPGGFTSLRIAASLAKGFAVANKIELHAIPSLQLAAVELRAIPGDYVLHSDALRGERFAQRFRVNGAGDCWPVAPMQRLPLSEVELFAARAGEAPSDGAGIIDVALVDATDPDTPASLVAVGSASVSRFDTHVVLPHARNALALRNMWTAFPAVDIPAWEPMYGRLAEAQVKWEVAHGRSLPLG